MEVIDERIRMSEAKDLMAGIPKPCTQEEAFGFGKRRHRPTRIDYFMLSSAARLEQLGVGDEYQRNITPAELLLTEMRLSFIDGDRERAVEIAKSIAPYCHAKLSAVDVTRNGDDAEAATDEALISQFKALVEQFNQPVNGVIVTDAVEAVAEIPVEMPKKSAGRPVKVGGRTWKKRMKKDSV